MPLETIIKDRIRTGGPISIADYMALALSHPEYGYYMRKDPLGAAGDFITAPEISQIFGELIGLWLAAQWIAMGKPQAILAELGPGRGTLLSDALRATKSIAGFHDAVSVHLVETSPALQEKQRESLAKKHPRLHWHPRFEDVPKGPLLLIANEFFDALPIRQFVQGKERMVALEKDRLIFTPLQGEVTESCETGEHIVSILSRRILTHGGAALIVDYGYEGGSRNDTLQAVRKHQYHDILADPGTADLTAHVDFDALKNAAAAGGTISYGPVSQRLFLRRLGADIRAAALCEKATNAQKSAMLSGLERLLSPNEMGELFKVLCIAHPTHPQPEGF